jgi:hypothetical protein
MQRGIPHIYIDYQHITNGESRRNWEQGLFQQQNLLDQVDAQTTNTC